MEKAYRAVLIVTIGTRRLDASARGEEQSLVPLVASRPRCSAGALPPSSRGCSGLPSRLLVSGPSLRKVARRTPPSTHRQSTAHVRWCSWPTPGTARCPLRWRTPTPGLPPRPSSWESRCGTTERPGRAQSRGRLREGQGGGALHADRGTDSTATASPSSTGGGRSRSSRPDATRASKCCARRYPRRPLHDLLDV